MSARRIGFIGAGKIGEPMVERLLAARLPTAVYARRSEVGDRLADRGGVPVESPDALAGNDVVIACLFDDQQVAEIATPIVAAMRPGAVFVSHTTGSPNALRALDAIARPRGVAVVEAPFSGTAEGIRAGRLTVLLGGDDEAVDIAEEVVSAYADRIIRAGALGSALSVKLINNALFAAHTQLTLTAIRIADGLGVAESTLLAALAVSSGGSAAAQHLSDSELDARAYSELLPHYLRKDVASARAVAAELDVDIAPLVAAVQLGPMRLIDEEPPTIGKEVS